MTLPGGDSDDEEAELTFDDGNGGGMEEVDKEAEVESKTTPTKKKAADVSEQELRDLCNKIMDEEYTAFSADDLQLTLLQRHKWNFRYLKYTFSSLQFDWNQFTLMYFLYFHAGH